MTTVLGIWHLVVEGGKDRVFQTPTPVQITNVAFGEEILDPNSRTVVKLTFESLTSGLDDDDDDDDDDDEEEKEPKSDSPDERIATTVLCSLTPGKIEQASVNLVLDGEALFKFEVTGKNTVYLTGNYIRQVADDEPTDSEGEYGLDEDAYDLREVSSDVEMHPDDLDELESDASRFEEIKDDEPVKQKRARESDAADAKSPAEKKNKKLKADEGKAIAVDATEGGKDKKDKKKKNAEEKTAKSASDGAEKKETKASAERTIAGGIVIEDAKIGTGPQAKKGSTVRMRYVGKLTNGKVFDKNTSGKPFTFYLGKGEVIKGWDEGIVGMQVGGERKLTIPPKMAYGSKKMSDIPPNSTLVFEVKLVGIA